MKDLLQVNKHESRINDLSVQPDKSEVQFINRIVSVILASGMYATIGFYLLGLILLFTKGDSVPEISKQYFHSFDSFVSGFLMLSPRPFLYLGTITLVLTPVSRVLISIFAFWKERDVKFVLVTAVVFVVILASVIAGMLFKINVG